MQITIKHSKVFLAVLFFIFYLKPKAQPNLVFNGEFNKQDTCINGVLALQNFSLWGWYTFSSADIYTPFDTSSSCFLSGFSLVPQNYLGFQYPRTGNNYAGVQTLTYAQNTDFRDYITGYLKDSLVPNKKHCVSFFASLVDTVNTACNDLGAAFTNLPMSRCPTKKY